MNYAGVLIFLSVLIIISRLHSIISTAATSTAAV